MSCALKASTDLTVFPLSLHLDAYPAGAMRGLQPDVRWGPAGASANRSSLEQTVIAVQTDTITTLSASGIQFIRQLPIPLRDPL